jgi:hypothetical protein
VESTLGAGSTFVVELPYDRDRGHLRSIAQNGNGNGATSTGAEPQSRAPEARN